MSVLFRATPVLKVCAPLTFNTVKYGRTSLKYAYSNSAFCVDKIVKLDTYESRRRNAEAKLQSATEDLRLRIVDSLDTMNAINSREIQELIFTARQEDLELVIASLKKLQLQSDRMRFSDFNMDAVVMRMFAYLKLPEEAFKTFLDEDFKKLFVGYNSVMILLDLLYKNRMYQQILDCVDCLERRQNFNTWSSRGVGSFYITSCLKINTPVTLKKALLHYEKILSYREPVPELTLLCTVIALHSNPPKADHYLKLLRDNPRYADFKKNVILQCLVLSGKLSDVKEYLKLTDFVLMKDSYDLLRTLASEETDSVDRLDKIVENCKILDVSLEDWVIQDNCKDPEEKEKSLNYPKGKRRKGHINHL